MEKYTLSKSERLSSKKKIDALFLAGSSFVVYPYRVVYMCDEQESSAMSSIMVSVPKKKFKRAVKRNLLRRRTKEAYRLHRLPLVETLAQLDKHLMMAILYLDKEEQPYEVLERKMKEVVRRLSQQLKITYLVDKEVEDDKED